MHGIAADDVDADGRLDLFVTNFYNESNALYRQQETGNFLDESGAWGIPQISQNMLGFGTQFLDAELDGLPDLIVVNGHVDDLTSQGIPFKMSAQYLRNIGGRFTEWPASELGPYFSRKILGRGLARIDWNLDGKEDFVVSHLESPAALIENQSENAGHYLAVELTGTQSARDAIGTQVTLEIGTRKYVKQLTAGDGYQASNHRRLVFGLGDHQRIDRISVRWPNGTTESFEEIAADGVVRLIEAKGMFRLPQLSFSEVAQ